MNKYNALLKLANETVSILENYGVIIKPDKISVTITNEVYCINIKSGRIFINFEVIEDRFYFNDIYLPKRLRFKGIGKAVFALVAEFIKAQGLNTELIMTDCSIDYKDKKIGISEHLALINGLTRIDTFLFEELQNK